MTEGHSAITDERDSARAGRQLGRSIREAFHGAPADAVVVFASASHDHAALLEALADAAGTETIVGASCAGEFEGEGGEARVSALGLRSDSMRFAVGLGRGVVGDVRRAVAEAVSGFQGVLHAPQAHRSALVMTDALAGHAELLVEEFTLRTAGNYRLFGGRAGDDGRFRRTHVFAGRAARTDAVAALEILSRSPVGVGASHGWEPAGPGMRVTEAEAHRLVGLNGIPAVHALQEHAERTGQKFHLKDPMPFFLRNVLGIRRGDGYRLRAPLAVQDDGAILCAAAVPEGSVVHVMKTTAAAAVQAARQATKEALRALGGARPAAGFVFAGVAARLRRVRDFADELEACARLLEPAGFVGYNTCGQIARAEGQSSGFHNCTAVVCVLPQ